MGGSVWSRQRVKWRGSRLTSVCLLQWTLLHSTTRNRKLLDAMHNHAPAADDVLGMLLDVADVEFRLREVYEGLLASKEERWAASQRAAVEAVAELGEFFSGSKVLCSPI